MPIRAENKNRYPKDWPTISAAIRERAGNRCEECGVKNYALGGRTRDGKFLSAQPTGTNGLRTTWPSPGEFAWCGEGDSGESLRIIRIVLTVAHLNHQPEDCRPENLRAWCQRCHIRYDAKMKAAGIRERARLQCASADFFPPLLRETADMIVRFETCERHRALEFLRRFYPSREVTDTPECAGPLLDLVAADIIRIPDPAFHPNGAVFPSKNWQPDSQTKVTAAAAIMHQALAVPALPDKGDGA